MASKLSRIPPVQSLLTDRVTEVAAPAIHSKIVLSHYRKTNSEETAVMVFPIAPFNANQKLILDQCHEFLQVASSALKPMTAGIKKEFEKLS